MKKLLMIIVVFVVSKTVTAQEIIHPVSQKDTLPITRDPAMKYYANLILRLP